MVPDLVAAVVVLLVAFFNLLLAGHAFALRNEPGMSSFGFGPLGVAGVAVAGALFRLTPLQTPITSPIATISAAVCFLGFAVDTWRLAGAPRVRVLLASVAVTASVAVGLTAFGIIQDLFVVSTGYLLASVVPWGPVCFVFLGQVSISRRAQEEQRTTSRLMVAAIAGSVLVAVAFTAIVAGVRRWDIPDPLLAVALAAECVTWVYIARRKVAVRLFVSRAITWMVLGVGLLVVTAASFRSLGYGVDLPRVLAAVTLTLLVGVGFLLLSEALSRRVDRFLEPTTHALEQRLSTARAEASGLRRRLEQIERLALAGELAATVAHEIKNPLAALRGYAELLGELSAEVSGPHRPAFDKAVRVIKEESDRINERVHTLLKVGRPVRRVDDTTPFSLAQIVSEAVALVEGEAGPARIQVTSTPCPQVRGDADAVRGALVNLLRNALEAQGEKVDVPVEVVVGAHPLGALAEVRDRGPGLPEAMRADPFVAFRTNKPGGNGLGLVIARTAVEAAGGTLTLVAGEPRGTCARIVLMPVSEVAHG